MKLQLKCLAILFVTGVLAVASTEAAGPKQPPKPRVPDKVVSVNNDTKMITITEGVKKRLGKYEVTPLTKITVNGKPGKLSDIKKDMKVAVVSTDGKTLSRLDAEDLPVDSKK